MFLNKTSHHWQRLHWFCQQVQHAVDYNLAYGKSVQYIPKYDPIELKAAIQQMEIELSPRRQMEIDANVGAIHQVVSQPEEIPGKDRKKAIPKTPPKYSPGGVLLPPPQKSPGGGTCSVLADHGRFLDAELKRSEGISSYRCKIRTATDGSLFRDDG